MRAGSRFSAGLGVAEAVSVVRIFDIAKAALVRKERDGELRVVLDAGTETATLAVIDSTLKVHSRQISDAELEAMWNAVRENPVALKYRDKLCVRDGYVFPSRYCD